MQGTSGSFSFNGVELLLPPTEYGWLSRSLIGVSGKAHPVYPAVREFEMKWDFMDSASFNQVQQFYFGIQSTGTMVVDLPYFSVTPFQFYSYTGCTLKEPEVGTFFEEHIGDVTLVIMKAR